MATQLLPRIWLLPSPAFFAMPRRLASSTMATLSGAVRLARGWLPQSVRTASRTTAAATFQTVSRCDGCTPRIRITRPPSRRRLLSWVSRTALPRLRPWKGGSRPCAKPAQRSSTASTPNSVMASGLAQGRVPRDGSSKPFGSGKRRCVGGPPSRESDQPPMSRDCEQVRVAPGAVRSELLPRRPKEDLVDVHVLRLADREGHRASERVGPSRPCGWGGFINVGCPQIRDGLRRRAHGRAEDAPQRDNEQSRSARQ